ncbi:hypothetical protein [Neolewinella persica]|uniref:hypothetical protein n=1 Tax=Neolewinella persica TaxID=70998 RepID=UPI000372686C|nr:hypothetical protein [Neolewinella persica]
MALEKDSDRLAAARKKLKNAMNIGSLLQRLDSLAFMKFPIVMSDTIGGVITTIAFDKLELYPEYAEVEVLLGMKLPQRTVSATLGQPKTDADGEIIEYVELIFGTPNLKISHNGGIVGEATLGLYNNVPIGTMDPNKFGFILEGWREEPNGLSGDQAGTQKSGTFVTIDCDGFVEMGVEAQVIFSRDWIVPVDKNGLLYEDGQVWGKISMVVQDWNNMLATVDLPDFALAEYPDLAFNLTNAVFDFSDYRNSPDVKFPPGYREAYLPPGNPNLWRGVYIQNLEMMLPPQFTTVERDTSGSNGQNGTGMLMLDDYGDHLYAGGKLVLPDFRLKNGMKDENGLPMGGPLDPFATGPAPLTYPAPAAAPLDTLPRDTIMKARRKIGVNDLIMDGHGVSGHFYADDIIPFDEGRMNERWQFSVSTLKVDLLASNVTSFEFDGRVALPVSEDGEAFLYEAFACIPEKRYNFTVITTETYEFNVFKFAEVTIKPGSYLKIESTPTSFIPSAVLYGDAYLRAGNNEGGATSEEEAVFSARVSFDGLQFSTRAPRMSMIDDGSGSIGFSDVRLFNYEVPIPLPRILFTRQGPRLTCDLSINTMAQGDNGFAATTQVSVLGKLDSTKTYDHYVNAGLDVSSVYVCLKLPSIQAIGIVHIFDDDPVYGEGFQGSLDVKIGPDPESPMFAVEMNAIFGKKDFEYWYVDALVESADWYLEVIPKVVGINGIGGGAYYHMKMESADLLNGGNGQLGVTTSGLKYVPNENIVLGLKVSVPFVNPKPPNTETLDGVATLEIAFSKTAIQDIMFYGLIEIISPAPPGADVAGGKLSETAPDRTKGLDKDKAETMKADSLATSGANAPDDAILGSLFLRMNFERGFEFQGTARVRISAAQGTITGEGGIDILVSAPRKKWHLYVGGYTDNSITAGDGLPLPPVSVNFIMGNGMHASAGAYFLIGNDLPGPPPIHPAAAAYFGIQTDRAHNRGALAEQAAQGTGFAFGAYIFAKIEKRTREKGKYKNNRVIAQLGAGFDVSLLKYQSNTRCSADTQQSPHGHKGWRATGRIWAFIDADVKYRGVGKNLGLGVLIDADLPNPTYLFMILKVKVVFNFTVELEIGDRCGRPML